jgi:hypothetical protein
MTLRLINLRIIVSWSSTYLENLFWWSFILVQWFFLTYLSNSTINHKCKVIYNLRSLIRGSPTTVEIDNSFFFSLAFVWRRWTCKIRKSPKICKNIISIHFLVRPYSSEYFFKFLFNCPFAELYRKLFLMAERVLLAGVIVEQTSHSLRSYMALTLTSHIALGS